MADEMGLGKTISAISLLVSIVSTFKHDQRIGNILSDKNVDPVLIVCPATVIQ